MRNITKPYKVLIIDDCSVITMVLKTIIESSKDLSVVGTAKDPFEARELIKRLEPDVVTLDVELPKMNGIDFLKKLMRLHPLPVLMVSSFTQQNSPITFKALDAGAVDFISKPNMRSNKDIEQYSTVFIRKLLGAASANLNPILDRLSKKHQNDKTLPNPNVHSNIDFDFKPDAFIAIGSSTGGVESIKVILEAMPNNCPPIVITQHIPPTFSASIAKRLNQSCQINVFEAKDNQKLEQGCAYIAPGDYHLIVQKQSNGLHAKINQSEKINLHRPSVDILFNSIVALKNSDAVGIILTGMGKDGAKGLLNLRSLGCGTIAQDKKTSIVWGMPKAAIDIDAAAYILPLEKISEAALTLAAKPQ